MNLQGFGRRLKELRKKQGLTQNSLARQIHCSAELISIWERAYSHQKRVWIPDRPSVLRLVKTFAELLTPPEAQMWVANLDYELGRQEINSIFSPTVQVLPTQYVQPHNYKKNLKRLNLLPESQLFGVVNEQQKLYQVLQQLQEPWLVAIDGIGGIGKTALAKNGTIEAMSNERYYDVAWVSAKHKHFSPAYGLKEIPRPALNADSLVDMLLDQFCDQPLVSRTSDEKKAVLVGILKSNPHLVVIDNLENVIDYQQLLPLLRKLAGPSRFVLTTRHSLQGYSDVYTLNLGELSRPNVFEFLQYEAKMKGITALAEASPQHMEAIYEIVGGNPLALKLITGQIGILPLSHVLNSLKEAQGKKIEELYNFIYWQAWQALDPISQHLLLIMPVVQNGLLHQLGEVSQLEAEELYQALEQLFTLSLIEGNGTIEDCRYSIHRLTETFLLTQVIKWQSLN